MNFNKYINIDYIHLSLRIGSSSIEKIINNILALFNINYSLIIYNHNLFNCYC